MEKYFGGYSCRICFLPIIVWLNIDDTTVSKDKVYYSSEISFFEVGSSSFSVIRLKEKLV